MSWRASQRGYSAISCAPPNRGIISPPDVAKPLKSRSGSANPGYDRTTALFFVAGIPRSTSHQEFEHHRTANTAICLIMKCKNEINTAVDAGKTPTRCASCQRPQPDHTATDRGATDRGARQDRRCRPSGRPAQSQQKNLPPCPRAGVRGLRAKDP